jgi:hypothetical protein
MLNLILERHTNQLESFQEPRESYSQYRTRGLYFGIKAPSPHSSMTCHAIRSSALSFSLFCTYNILYIFSPMIFFLLLVFSVKFQMP